MISHVAVVSCSMETAYFSQLYAAPLINVCKDAPSVGIEYTIGKSRHDQASGRNTGIHNAASCFFLRGSNPRLTRPAKLAKGSW